MMWVCANWVDRLFGAFGGCRDCGFCGARLRTADYDLAMRRELIRVGDDISAVRARRRRPRPEKQIVEAEQSLYASRKRGNQTAVLNPSSRP